MSYADVAASGPKQTPEEARAPQLPQPIRHDESSTASLVDVDSPHVSSVESSFKDAEVKTETQASRLRAEASEDASKLRSMGASEAEKAKKKASTAAKKTKAEAKAEWKSLQDNSDNPVVIGNAVIWAIGATALGFAGYKRYSEGKLDGQVAALTAAGIAAFATVDYFASQWLFENKYPTK